MIKPYISKNNITIYQGCALEVLKEMEDKSVDMCMTSPPYWGLRDYGIEGQLGLEPTYQEYIDKLIAIFDRVKNVLKDTGSCWVNLGDTYSTVSGSMGDSRFKQPKYEVAEESMNFKQGAKTNLQSKSLIGIPERFMLAMIDRGWILRNKICWYKPNVMPSSASDRFTMDWEHVFFFVKQGKYYFEQQFEQYTEPMNRWGGPRKKLTDNLKEDSCHAYAHIERDMRPNSNGRNKRCVWQLSTEPYPDAHFATYPEKLCETPIKAGCPSHICKKCGNAREKVMETTEEYAKHLGKSWHDHKNDSTMGFGQQTRGFSSRKSDVSKIQRFKDKGYTDCGCNAGFEGGVVMDIFMGSGTTLKVARELGRKGIGIELSGEYIEMAIKRINLKQSLFKL